MFFSRYLKKGGVDIVSAPGNDSRKPMVVLDVRDGGRGAAGMRKGADGERGVESGCRPHTAPRGRGREGGHSGCRPLTATKSGMGGWGRGSDGEDFFFFVGEDGVDLLHEFVVDLLDVGLGVFLDVLAKSVLDLFLEAFDGFATGVTD